MLSVFLFKNRKVLTFVLLLTMSFGMMAIATSQFTLNLKSIFLTVLYPFEYVFNAVLGFFKSTWKSIGQLETVRNELIETRKRLKVYEETVGDAEKLKAENQRLRKLIDEREKVHYDYVLASIVSTDPQNLYQSIVVNRGSDDGVKANMPVIAYKDGKVGVVGKVIETTAHAARISTLREPKFYIGAQLEASRYYGLVQGRGMSKAVALDYIDINAPIKVGDTVVTSGQSDLFPKGLHVGTVIYIDRERGQFFLQAAILPAINFAELEDVYIVKRLPNQEIERMAKEGAK